MCAEAKNIYKQLAPFNIMDLEALFRLTYGMYVVGSFNGESVNGQAANSVFQVTAEPPKIAISISKHNLTHEFIEASKVFSVCVLELETPLPWLGPFGFRSGRDMNKLENVRWRKGVSGAPLIEDHCVAAVEAEVTESLDLGTHTLFIGKVINSEVLNDNKIMSYADYREKKGRTPDKAPTYRGNIEVKT